MNNIKLIIFDLDGTIIDSANANYKAYHDALEEIGVNLTRDFFDVHCFNGQHYKDFLPKLIPNYTDKIIEKVHDRKQEIYKNNMSNINVHPYLKYVIENTPKNIKLSLATTAARIAVKNVLRAIEMENMFDLVVTGDDVKNRKPNPEVFIKCMEYFNTLPKETLIFEDSDIGIEAANKTGAWILKVENWAIN
ncbi:HAD family hydrolase [Brachyspira pilosicoli]